MKGILVKLAVIMVSLIGANAVPITIDPADCVNDFIIGDWKPQRFGPYNVCNGGTVTFDWTGMHGVFQIPTIACPSNFTAGETDLYKFLAAASDGGQYVWTVPNVTGHYWVTSQYGSDCINNMLAEIYVTSPGDKPFISSALRMQAGTATAVLLSVAAVLLSNLLT